MIPATADGLEIAWTALGALGLLAVLLLLPILIRDVRKTYHVRDWDGLMMAGANLALDLISLNKIAILLALGIYSLGQPPPTQELTTSAVLIRAGFVWMEWLIVLPPWILLGARRWIDRRKEP